MQSNRLTSSLFQDLTKEIYDSANMIRLSTYPLQFDSTLIDFVNAYPVGVYQTQVYNNYVANPIFGRTSSSVYVDGGDSYDVYGNCIHSELVYTHTEVFFFGIKIRQQNSYSHTVNSPGTNC
ncbi:MAG: hypothetical protein ABIT96_07310 [Ferruginibacter sp.]